MAWWGGAGGGAVQKMMGKETDLFTNLTENFQVNFLRKCFW